MEQGDNLIVKSMKKQCDSMIRKLGKSNQDLDEVKIRIQEFMENNDLDSLAFTTAKRHVERYLFVIIAMKIANNYDISDCVTLKRLCGNKDYKGSEIVPQIKTLTGKLHRYEDEYVYYESRSIEEQDNFWGPIYRFLMHQAKYDVDHTTKLLAREQAKSDKFDEIAGATENLFAEGVAIRSKARSTLETLGQYFIEHGEYPIYYDDSWKTDLVDTIFDAEIDRAIYLSDGTFLDVIDEDGKRHHGGSQMWFKDGTVDGDAICHGGCGLIAIVDFLYRMEGVNQVSRKDFMERTMELYQSDKGMQKDFKSGNGVAEYIPFKKDDAESYLENAAKSAGYGNVGWRMLDRASLGNISDQLRNNIPVVFAVQEAFSGDEKLDLYSSPLDLDTHARPSNDVTHHYMTVTAVRENANLTTGDIETMLEVSSWGKKYYIKFDDLINFSAWYAKVSID